MLRSSQWRLAATYLVLIAITMGAVTAHLLGYVRATYLDGLGQRLDGQAGLVAQAALPHVAGSGDTGPLQALAQEAAAVTGARVTIIAADGTVLADSAREPAALPNLAQRPEVVAALLRGSGAATRTDDVLGQEVMYRAVAVGRDGAGAPLAVVRVALPTSQVQQAMRHIVLVVVAAGAGLTLLAGLVALLVARRQTRALRAIAQVAQRVAAGDLAQRVDVTTRDEMGDVGRAFNMMANSLESMVTSLAQERDKLEAVLGTMSDGVVVVDARGTVVLANAAAEHLTGAVLRRPSAVHFMDAVPDHVLKETVETCLRTGQPQQRETAFVRTRRYVRIIATSMARTEGSVLLVLQDRTEARRIEVTRREFVANVSHELRTPVTTIKALVETLRGGASEDRGVADDFLRRIENETERLARLVNDLFELSRLETGEVRLVLAPVAPEPLLEAAIERFHPIAQAQGQTLELARTSPLPGVLADAERVQQVLANLITNALRFTPPGGRITVSALARNGYVLVEVQDTGPGIPPEHLPHVFERFYKADRARRSEGTGLGLAIVKHIVQLHGGEVGVRSREGEGATFWFSLPAAAPAA